MQRFFIAQSLQDAKVLVGGGEAQGGWETHDSRIAITVMTNITATEEGKPATAEPVEVQIWLTIPQVAVIVVAFFAGILPLGKVYRSFLRRLLHKRWAHMTAEVAKSEFGWPIERYTKV